MNKLCPSDECKLHVIGVFNEDGIHIGYINRSPGYRRVVDSFKHATKWNRQCDATQCMKYGLLFSFPNQYKVITWNYQLKINNEN